MRAILYDRFGPPDVLYLGERPDPAPGPGEALVRVRAAALNPKDVLVRKGRMKVLSGERFPRGTGQDLCGEVVEARGGDLQPGQRVYGMLNSWDAGACAELAAAPQDELAPAPPSLSDVEAASLPLAALTALQAIRDLLALQPDQRICVNGAAGGVGTLAVQIAAILGGQVTAVCSGRNVERVRALGAHEVIDYTQEDVSSRAGTFDAFFDVFGSQPWPKARVTLAPGGRFVTAIPRAGSIRRELMGRLGLSRARLVSVRSVRADLEQLTAWVEAGALRPVVDRVMPLEASAEAHAYIETRRARGKVVLTVG